MGYYPAGAGVTASQQFGAGNQTDVFSVSDNGQLNVNFVDNAGEWQGPIPIGPTNFAPAGCPVVASRQFGLNQTDVFLVGNNGQLQVFWVDNAGGWGGPEGIGPANSLPAGANLATSQQFGITNQTDVFVVDKNGQLNVFWVVNAGAWGGPVKIGPSNAFTPGCPVAASQQFGIANQTDAFIVDKNGQLNVFWVTAAGAWQGPEKIGPSTFTPGAPLAASQQFGLNQTDVFIVDKNGSINVFWVDTAGPWNGPEKLPGSIFPAAAPLAVSQQFGCNNQTDVFCVDKTGQLRVNWVNNAGAWQGPEAIGPAGNANAGTHLATSQQFGCNNQTDVFLIDKNGQLDIFWVNNAGAWNGPLVRGNPVAAPAAGLGSNSNYLLCNQAHITGLSVTINVTQDITGSDGFGFQVNCYSAAADYDGGQQYLIYLAPGGSPQLTAMVDNWHTTSDQLINTQPKLASLSAHTLPAGYKLKISLTNDASGNINGATYQAWDNNGNSIGNVTINLLSLSGVTQQDLDPIVAFQLNFVDYLNGGITVLSSGAGTISYSASVPLTVLNTEPSYVDWDFVTVERANSVYGPLSSSVEHSYTQSFNYTTGATIAKKATVNHVTAAKKAATATP